MGKKYTEEHIEWLRSFAPGHWVDEIRKTFFEKFGIEVSKTGMRSLLKRFNIKTNAKTERGMSEILVKLTNPEQDKAVHERFHFKGGTYLDVQAFLKNNFGIEMTLAQVKSYANRKKLILGTYGYFPKGHVPKNKGKKVSSETYAKCKPTMFKPGNIPKNWRPVGSERLNVDGYVEVKVAEPNKWKLKHRLIWEQKTGQELNKKDLIIFLDKNKLNFDIDNLALVTNKELVRLNQMHLINENPDISRVGITLAKLIIAKRSQENAENRKCLWRF